MTDDQSNLIPDDELRVGAVDGGRGGAEVLSVGDCGCLDVRRSAVAVDRRRSLTVFRPDGSPLSVEVERARLIRSDPLRVSAGSGGSVPLAPVVMLLVVQLAAVAALVAVAL